MRTMGTPKHQQYHAFRLLCAIANNAHPRTKAPLTAAQRRKLAATVAAAVVAGVFRHDYGANLTPDGSVRRAKRRQSILPLASKSSAIVSDDAPKHVAPPFDVRAHIAENDARLQRMIDTYFAELRVRYPGRFDR